MKTISIKAPVVCSLIESPELTIKFFSQIDKVYKQGDNVVFDLSECTTFTETSTALLSAYLKDRNINFGRPGNIIFPNDLVCKKVLHDRGILKKYDTEEKEIALCNMPVKKVANKLVANDIARELVKSSSNFIYGEEKRVKELYSSLIEVMANTNNHASSKKDRVYSWWLSMYPDELKKTVKFVFIDLGVGIFQSIPVKQYVYQNPQSIFSIDSIRQVEDYSRKLKIAQIFSALIDGKIKSSTGDPTRGRGLPLIAKNAKSGHFKEFKMIANDAFIDLISNETSMMNEHFSGTLYYFELAVNKI
jgi:hypothetical protein